MMNININELSQQFQGATLPKLVEKHVRAQSEKQLLLSISGTLAQFPPDIRDNIYSYLEKNLARHWFNEETMNLDLGTLLLRTIDDLKGWAKENSYSLSEKEIFDIFNTMVMYVAGFAHREKDFRRSIGIKKGVFS